MDRVKLVSPAESNAPKKPEPSARRANTHPVLPTGATLLDLGLNGGYAQGRIINVIGSTAAGKTLFAIEACANFAMQHGIKDIRYNETENAFDRDYAESIGLPPGIKFVGDEEDVAVNRRGSRTMEHWEADFAKWIKPRIGKGKPCMYITDSFDAMEAEKELKRDFGDRQPGVKAGLTSEFFRAYTADIDAANCYFVIISQLRDAIGVVYGDKEVRSGGRALDFYGAQLIWLSTSRKITAKVGSPQVERTVGSHTTFNVKKNKIGKPFARAPLVVMYEYGVDDEMSNIEWLLENKLGAAGRLTLPIAEYADSLREMRKSRDFDTILKMRAELVQAVTTRWEEIDEAMRPPVPKYSRA